MDPGPLGSKTNQLMALPADFSKGHYRIALTAIRDEGTEEDAGATQRVLDHAEDA